MADVEDYRRAALEGKADVLLARELARIEDQFARRQTANSYALLATLAATPFWVALVVLIVWCVPETLRVWCAIPGGIAGGVFGWFFHTFSNRFFRRRLRCDDVR